MSYDMPPYTYSSLLPGPNSIRLLRLRPPEGENATIRCQLLNYSLDGSDRRPPGYEALSYVWGDPKKTLPIFVDEHRFNITENLHVALWYLRNRAIEWVWVDAICINQRDQQERGHQVRYMAKIYGRAHRVLVWLGQAEDNSDRAFEEIRARKKWPNSLDDQTIKQAVLALLQRPWFRRIWILQEIAAARRILVMCGLAEIDGYSFCLGLKSLEVFYESRPDLHNLIRSVTYLIRQANFRPTYGICWSDMSFLAIRPLGELLDMFHTHKATERHDKVYALLGMSSDAPYAADLFPDYDVPWGQLFQRLIKFLLSKRVALETWDDKEMVIIKSKGYILGQVSSAVHSSGWGDTQKVDIISKDISTYLGYTREWSARLTLHNSTKSIRPGDLVYLVQGAIRPTIIRICKDHFAVIMITATPPEYIQTENERIRWSEILRSVRIFPHDFLLIWDWAKPFEVLEEYEAPLEAGGRVQEHLNIERKVTRLETMTLILEDLNKYEEAKETLREVIKINERAFGKEHPDTLTSMDNLASTYRKQGRWKEAEELFVQVLETRKRVLGKEYQDTLNSMNNLASTFWDEGRWREAEELFVQVIETRKRMLREEHPSMLTSMDNPALMYRKQGRWREAEELEVKMMEICLRALGRRHPDTLTSLGNLASTIRNQGRWKEAEDLEVQVMEMSTRVLGDEHSSTLTSMANLASTLWNQGRWKEAEELDVQVMKTSARVLGEEHLDTLTSMANLASTYRDQGRWKEAEELQAKDFKICLRVLGERHPDTLTSLGNLASTIRNQGRWKEAEDLEVQVMETSSRVLGDEHPSTLTSMANLASTYRDQGQWKEAEELQAKELKICIRVLGEEHPDTLTSMGNLASTFQNQGRWKEAEELQAKELKICTRVLGEEHPDALISMANLALTFQDQGRWKEAEDLEVQVMETRKRVLGDEHPDTLTSMNNFAFTLKGQGHGEKAVSLMEKCFQLRTQVLGPQHPYTSSSLSTLTEWRVENEDISF